MGECDGLSDALLRQFEKSIMSEVERVMNHTSLLRRVRSAHSPASFLSQTRRGESARQMPLQANVHVVPSDVNFPSESSMAQAFADRTDAMYQLIQSKILER